MRIFLGVVLFAFLAFCFVLLQQSALYRWTLLSARPDLLVLLTISLAVRTRPALGAVAGFVCGTCLGLAAGAGLAPNALSLAIPGFIFGFIALTDLRVTPVIAGALVAMGTILAHVLLLFMAPPSDIPRYLTATIGSAIMNGVLAMPLDSVWRRLIGEAVD